MAISGTPGLLVTSQQTDENVSFGETVNSLLASWRHLSLNLCRLIPDMFGVIAESSHRFNTSINDMVVRHHISNSHLPALVTCTPAHTDQLRASRQWRSHPYFYISPDSQIDQSIGIFSRKSDNLY